MPLLEPTIERRGNYLGVPIKRVSWSSIASGVLVGVALFVTLSTLAIALGLIQTEPRAQPGVLSGISWTIVAALSLFGGGWIAGRLSGLHRSLEGILHGLVTWAVASVALLAFAGSFSMTVHELPGEQAFPPPFERAEGPSERQGMLEGEKMEKTRALKRERMEIERRARAFLVEKTLDLQQQQEIFDQLLPDISALVDAFMRPKHTKERERLIQTLVDASYIGREAIEQEVEHWIAIVTREVDERRHKKRKQRGAHMRSGHVMEPGATISPAPRVLAGWTFLFVVFGAAAAMLGGWLGSHTVNGKTLSGQTIAAKNPTPPETD